jgi:chemotaxis protein methyltransferase CheR
LENQDQLNFFAAYIERELGIVYANSNYFQLEHRLKNISEKLGLDGVSELFQKAQFGIKGEMKTLILDLATNNETSFFRDPAIFAALRDYIIPKLLEDSAVTQLRVWSAASSAGQEVYSIAMELARAQKSRSTFPVWSILASDISSAILKRAEEGVYSDLEIQRGLGPEYRQEFFDAQDNGSSRVKPLLKKNLQFRTLNLIEDWPGIGPFELVFCRNVLIYQSVESKKKVLRRIYEKLVPGGFLVLGAAESLFGLSEDFGQVSAENAVFYRKKKE